MRPRLVAVLAVALSLGILGCGGGAPPAALGPDGLIRAHGLTLDRAALGEVVHLFIYPDYLDPNLLEEFRSLYGVTVVVDYYDTNEALIAKLSAGGTGLFDVVVPSGYGVSVLRRQDLLEPLDPALVPNRGNLRARFRGLPFDPDEAYSVGYMWGVTGLGLRRDRLPPGTPAIDSLKVLFDPASSVGPFALLDDQRETMGLALKYLGYSLNSRNPSELKAAEQLLAATRARALAWTGSSTARDMLAAGDVVIEQQYSGDVAMARAENPAIEFVFPREGGSVWTDNLAIPRGAPHRLAAHALINYLLDAAVGARLANFTRYATPNQAALAMVDPALRADPGLYPEDATLANFEYVQDVGEATRLYVDAWTRIKATGP